jgi:hypothetical protein
MKEILNIGDFLKTCAKNLKLLEIIWFHMRVPYKWTLWTTGKKLWQWISCWDKVSIIFPCILCFGTTCTCANSQLRPLETPTFVLENDKYIGVITERTFTSGIPKLKKMRHFTILLQIRILFFLLNKWKLLLSEIPHTPCSGGCNITKFWCTPHLQNVYV